MTEYSRISFNWSLPPPYTATREGGGHSHTWTWWETSALLTPIFDIFRSHWFPFLCPTRSHWPPLSTEKIGLCLSHSVPEIIWGKSGLIFHKNLLFDHFVPIFSLIFDLIDPFFTVLRSFWPLIFTKPQILLGPFFHHVLDPPYWKFGEVVPPAPRTATQVKFLSGSPPLFDMGLSLLIFCLMEFGGLLPKFYNNLDEQVVEVSPATQAAPMCLPVADVENKSQQIFACFNVI